uniref:Protein kinase domain-containing protein n=1 Tax=Oryzias sinensis TaxID=183150 RepID=A0A8C7Z954_9TELE
MKRHQIVLTHVQRVNPRPHLPEKLEGCAPVLRSLRPERYDTVPPTAPMLKVDSFGRLSEPEAPTRSADKWTLRAVPEVASATTIDLESLLRDGKSVLGRGGFGVTVRIEEGLVAKINLFPEMLNWSLPVAEDEFKRFVHIATQMEEVLIGVSIKHPNVLRTFGGLWCEAPGYPLGGRVVSLMEEAVCSLHEYAPLVELDVLRALDHLRSRNIQHRDITHRNVLVCRAESRKPLPLVFKISDFGTACNFSTPDQPRGTRANRAPEMLWCLESDTQADVFSWYCMIWELYSGTPLISHRQSSQRKGFCSRTYARNLSELLGTYDSLRGLRNPRPPSARLLFTRDHVPLREQDVLRGRHD